MAEQVNQRIEDMINELEQMRRTSLYNDDEIKEISRKRKEYEYHIQRHVKHKEDFTQYIAYEIALLEDIADRRKNANLTEKKKDIEYAIAKRLNKVFKQFIYRFQNDVEVYFEYLKFCKSVGFNSAASAIIGQMLQMHGDKPKMWLLASKWESEEEKNVEGARQFLLKGLQRHTNAEVLYMELFKAELLVLAFSTETEKDTETLLKRADVVWRNGIKSLDDVSFLFKCLDLILKYNVEGDMKESIKLEIWARNDKKEVWTYIAEKELEGCHWEQIEAYVVKDAKYPDAVNYCIGVFNEALTRFPEDNLCTKYIHTLLEINDSVCEDSLKIDAVSQAWWSGLKRDLLTNDMFSFGIQILKLQGALSDEALWKLLDGVSEKQTKLVSVWEEKLLLSKSDESKMMSIIPSAIKVLTPADAKHLYSVMIDNISTNQALKTLLDQLRNCENEILLSMKPKLLQKTCKQNGLLAARDLYEEFIKTPPIQLEVNTVMIELESLQAYPNERQIRKCYECAVLHHGSGDADIWNDYIEFEIVTGDPVAAPAIYRRALSALTSNQIVEFIKKQTMHRSS